MSELSLEQKKAQFDEYFSIAHRINANMRPLGEDEVVPDEENLEESMPYAFRIASEMAAIEAQAIRPLRNLSDHAESLADYLNHQSRKIDLMMSFVLHQQDEPEFRFKSNVSRGILLLLFSHSSPYISIKDNLAFAKD